MSAPACAPSDLAGRRPAPGLLGRALRAGLARLGLWRRRARQRSELRHLSERELRDFGASRSEAVAEARKPFWRA